jgi:hypothetical protein
MRPPYNLLRTTSPRRHQAAQDLGRMSGSTANPARLYPPHVRLATFVRAARFEVEAGFDPQPVAHLFLVPRNGMPMRVTMRESAARQ